MFLFLGETVIRIADTDGIFCVCVVNRSADWHFKLELFFYRFYRIYSDGNYCQDVYNVYVLRAVVMSLQSCIYININIMDLNV